MSKVLMGISLVCGSILIAGSAPLQAQVSPQSVVSPKDKMQASIARQLAAAQAVGSAVDRQRLAVQRQTHRDSTQGFFVLAPVTRTLQPAPAAEPACQPLPAAQVNSLITAAAQKQGLPPELLESVAKQESAFRPCAVSEKGAMGVMQLMPETAADLHVGNPFDAGENINAGAKLLKELLNRYGGDMGLTLAAYNAGPARVDAIMDIPRIPETENYVRRILGTPALRNLMLLRDPTLP